MRRVARSCGREAGYRAMPFRAVRSQSRWSASDPVADISESPIVIGKFDWRDIMWPFRKQTSPAISWFSGESAEMNGAITEAQASFSHFFDAVCQQGNNSYPILEVALVKYGFEATKNGVKVEHVFLSDVRCADSVLWGIVNADPAYTDEVSEGDSIIIDRDRVSDWLYVVDGKGTGGFTFKLMWSKFSPEEKSLYGSQPPFIWLVNQFS